MQAPDSRMLQTVIKTTQISTKALVFSGVSKKSGGLIWENRKSIDYLERKKKRKSFVI